MIHALTPILYLTKKGVPKPPFLDPSIIQQLNDQVRWISTRSSFDEILLARYIGFITPGWLYDERSRWLYFPRWNYTWSDCFPGNCRQWISSILWWIKENEKWECWYCRILPSCKYCEQFILSFFVSPFISASNQWCLLMFVYGFISPDCQHQ